jgi:hypothetical protein
MHWPWKRGPDGGAEDEPGASSFAIMARRRKVGQELAAGLYLYDDRLFVCPMQWIAETGEPDVLPTTIDDETLGRSICDRLACFDPGGTHDLRGHKKTDWPAWRASGAETVKSFEQSAYRVDIRTIGTLIAFEAAPLTTLHSGVCVRAVVSPLHGEVGAAAQRALRGVQALREANIL